MTALDINKAMNVFAPLQEHWNAIQSESPERLIEEADKALYKDKENGRNRVELADFVHY